MTDILAEAIRAGCNAPDEFCNSPKCDYPKCCRCGETNAQIALAALRSAYPRDPSAATLKGMAIGFIGQHRWNCLNAGEEEVEKAHALNAYRKMPLWIALYATSPSEPT